MKKVTDLFEVSNSCFHIDAKQTIENFQKFLSENPGYEKVLLICLDTSDSKFVYSWMKARMSNQEGIAVLMTIVDDLVEYLKGGDD